MIYIDKLHPDKPAKTLAEWKKVLDSSNEFEYILGDRKNINVLGEDEYMNPVVKAHLVAVPKPEIVSDCCGEPMDDQDIRNERCPDCKESCKLVEVV